MRRMLVRLRLREIMLKHSLTDVAVVELFKEVGLDMDATAVSRYRRGLRMPNVEAAALMSKALRVSLDDMIEFLPAAARGAPRSKTGGS